MLLFLHNNVKVFEIMKNATLKFWHMFSSFGKDSVLGSPQLSSAMAILLLIWQCCLRCLLKIYNTWKNKHIMKLKYWTWKVKTLHECDQIHCYLVRIPLYIYSRNFLECVHDSIWFLHVGALIYFPYYFLLFKNKSHFLLLPSSQIPDEVSAF